VCLELTHNLMAHKNSSRNNFLRICVSRAFSKPTILTDIPSIIYNKNVSFVLVVTESCSIKENCFFISLHWAREFTLTAVRKYFWIPFPRNKSCGKRKKNEKVLFLFSCCFVVLWWMGTKKRSITKVKPRELKQKRQPVLVHWMEFSREGNLNEIFK
jgi:hypothetical protein